MSDIPTRTSLRQRSRFRREDENLNLIERAYNNNDNNNDNDVENYDRDMDIILQQYKKITANSGWAMVIWCRALAALFILLAMLFIATSTGRKSSSTTTTRKDLKLLTVYPRSVSPFIHEVEGQTEILVTNDNREAVRAVRTSIGMANNLQYHGHNDDGRLKRRKGGMVGILLRTAASLRSISGSSPHVEKREGIDNVPGDTLLEPYGEVKMRSYLLEHGVRCSSSSNGIDQQQQQHKYNNHGNDIDLGENTVLLRFDQLISSITETTSLHLDDAITWNRALHLFAWCQFANGDARGYVAHGTSVKPGTASAVVDNMASSKKILGKILEDQARLAGLGIAVMAKQEQSRKDGSQAGAEGNAYDGLQHHYSPLFVMPDGATSREMARGILHSILLEEEEAQRISSSSIMPSSKSSLLFKISDKWLQTWNSMIENEREMQTNNDHVKDLQNSDSEMMKNGDGTASPWVFLESLFGTEEEGAALSGTRLLASHCEYGHCSFILHQNV